MIEFDDMDSRLAGISRDRAWLAKESGYSEASVREALAPASKKRSPRMQRILSETVEREEKARAEVTSKLLPERFSVEGSRSEFDAWCRAYKVSPFEHIEDWAVSALNITAETSIRGQTLAF